MAGLDPRGAVRRLLVTHLDPAGIARARLFPTARIAHVLGEGFTASVSSAAFFTPGDVAVDAVGTDAVIGDLLLTPDASRLRLLDAETGLWHAPADLRELDGAAPFVGCGRESLRRAVGALGEAGVTARAGFELEFTVSRGDDATPAHSGPAYGQRPLLVNEVFALEVLEALEHAGVAVQHLHAEHGDGQFELALAPQDPLAAADDYLLSRLVVERCALRAGVSAHFDPIPPAGAAANGMHIHLSLQRGGVPLFASGDGIPPAGLSAIAGILDAMPALTALLSASELSYQRLRPGRWSGAVACWGPGNREAAIRYVPALDGDPASANIEIKSGDATAHPHIALAGVLHAALDGLRRSAVAPPPLMISPGNLSDEERATVAPPLPSTLGVALAALDGERMLRTGLGDDLVDLYIAVRTPRG